MNKALFLYSSTDGQTIKIFEHIINDLKSEFECELINLHSVTNVAWHEYDKVMIGASVRYGHLNKKLYQFIENNHSDLDKNKVAFFCVNLTARKEGKDTIEGSTYMRKFLQKSPWHPKMMAVFAGALFYPRYKWFDRMMIKLIMRLTGGETDTSKEVEYTDWHKVSTFAQQFCAF